MNHETASPARVKDHKDADGTSPNPDDLHWDMRMGPDSLWNAEVINILFMKLEDKIDKDKLHLPLRSKGYLLELIEEKYRRVNAVWKRAQPKKTEMNLYETPQDVEQRVLARKAIELKMARTNGRRRAVSMHHASLFQFIIDKF